MARKKADDGEGEGTPELNVNDQIEKQHGSVILSADQFFARDRPTVSISPAWDWASGGGISVGSWGVINGPSKIGKSLVTFQVMANAQEQLGMKALIAPVEGRYNRRDMDNIHNLDKSSNKLEILFSTEDNILSAEKQLEILDAKMRAEKRLIIFIDSFSALMEEDRHQEFGKSTRGKLGQLLSAFCNRNAHVVPLREHIVLGVTHTIANTGNGMATKYEKMPSSMSYQHDFKAKWIWSKDSEWMSGNDQIGLCTKWKIETHTNNVPINREFVSRILFNHGISHEAEIMDFALQYGFIKKAGAWYSYEEGETKLKGQGWDGFFELLCAPENKHIYDAIHKEVMEYLQ